MQAWDKAEQTFKKDYNARTKKYLTKEMETEKGKPTWTMLASAMKKALADTVTIEKNALEGWYEMSKETITPLIKQRTRILHKVRADPTLNIQAAKEMCITARKNVREAIAVAKSKWASSLARKIHNIKLAPKEAWNAARKLQEGLTGHNAKPTTKKSF